MQHLLALAPAVSFAALQLTVIGVAYIVSQIVGQTKQALNLLIKPENPYQNLAVRMYVFAVAAAFTCGYAWFHSALNSRADLGAAIGLAMNAGLYAIAGYHLLQSSDQPTVTVLQGKAIDLPKPANLAPLAPATSVGLSTAAAADNAPTSTQDPAAVPATVTQ